MTGLLPSFAAPALLAALALGAAASVALRRPWTAPLAALLYRETAGTPLFKTINMTLSAMWAGLLLWLAYALFARLPLPAQGLPMAVGGLASMIVPPLWIRAHLNRLAAGDRRNPWPRPDFTSRPAVLASAASYDVAVIGSGMGGLTAAALLADRGLRVVVAEQHDRPGGFCHTWVRRARDEAAGKRLLFRFDSGVHDFSGWRPGGSIDALLTRLGVADAVSWLPLDHRYLYAADHLDVPRDWRAFVARLGERFPHQAAGISALFDEIHQIYTGMYSTARFHGGFPGQPVRPDDYLTFAREHPLAAAWLFRPWRELVTRHVTDEGALAAVEALAEYRTEDPAALNVATMVPIYGYYFHGGAYPAGGSGRLADVLVEAIRARGGEVRLRTAVRRVVQENGVARGIVVRDIRGQETTVNATAVICNGDPGLLARDLLADSPQRRLMLRQFGDMTPSCSVFSLHLGLRGAIDMPPIVHVKTADMPTELIFPSVVDPTCAPAGYSTLEMMQMLTPEDAATWFPASGAADLRAYRRSQAYLARKQVVTARMLDTARRIIPDLDARIVYRSDASPVTFNRYCWTRGGAIYGLKNPAGGLPVKTPVRNLVLAGSTTQGGGVEATVLAGAFAAHALLADALETRAGAPAPRRPSDLAFAPGGVHAA